MSNWLEQTETLMKSWQDAQQKALKDWFSFSKQGEYLQNMQEEQKKMLDTWQASINKGFEAQQAWLDMWASNFSGKDMPKAMSDWANQSSSMLKQMSDSQKKFSDMWFDMAKKADMPAFKADAWQEQGQKVMHMWQDAANSAVKMQLDMAKSFSENVSKAAAKN